MRVEDHSVIRTIVSFVHTVIQFEKMQSASCKPLPVSVHHAVIYVQKNKKSKYK